MARDVVKFKYVANKAAERRMSSRKLSRAA